MNTLAKIFSLALAFSSVSASAATVMVKKGNTVTAHDIAYAGMRQTGIDINVNGINGPVCIVGADFIKSIGIDALALLERLNSVDFDYVVECSSEYDKSFATRIRPRLLGR